ncbi:hypothetical protein THERMOT_749 [Bathymodiolus thermophilus thioautotrophic gill symbiont]|nr:DUF1566 domain-containing protein [Bathymodiolus thermophilus thioautotrophic gill symbiont]CAB5497801.1 hypothetical protein THERMOT_749 [Bathymodiolus thermophilus thioautotrophic gill symbiont]
MFNFLKYFLIVLTLVLQSCGSSGGGNSGSGLTQPTNLNAVAGDKLVNLSWNKVSGVDSYNVYHSTSNITSLSDLSKINTNTLAKTILNLTNNTKYYFVVTAVKGDIESAPSAVVDATPIVVLHKPLITNLPAKHLILNSAITAFAFNNTGGTATSCNALSSLPNGLSVTLANGSCQISGTPTTLQNTTTYTITATNAAGDDTATISISVDLDTPKNLIATEDNASVGLTWDAVSGATGYQVYYAKQSFDGISNDNLSSHASSNGGSLLQNITDNNKTVTNLINNTRYYFVVTAVKGDTEGAPSAVVDATPVVVLHKPLIANLPAKHLILNSSITAFAFNNTGGTATSCNALSSLPNGLSVTLANGSCQISGTPTTLQNTTTYTITAVNAIGNDTATISISVDLDTPKNLTATEGNASVDLTWDAVSGATGYQVYYAKQSFDGISNDNLSSHASSNGGSLLQNITDNNKTVTNLTNNTRYYFVVTAVKGDTEGAPSAVVDATPVVVLHKPLIANLPAKHLILNSSITAFAFNNTGGTATSCNVFGSLPNGLSVTLANGSCQISGTPTTLRNTTTYTIAAVNAIGDDTATISISVDLDMPKNLIATKGNISVNLTWDAVSGAIGYQVYYAKQSFSGISDNLSNYASLNGGSLLQNITDNNKTIANLTNGTKYYFVVTATKNTFESSGSDEVTATPQIPIKMLNDTGITLGGDYPSSNNSTCTGVEISAQDCSHGRDARAAAGTLTKVGGGKAGFDFTKLGSTGNVLAIQNVTWAAGGAGTESAGTKWSCVKDNHTGLVWEVKTDDGSKDDDTTDNTHTNIHHKGNRYRWGGKTASGRNHADNRGTYYNDWTGLVDGTNTENLCGGNNWRVPTLEELHSIADLSTVKPAIDTHYFPNFLGTATYYFWSTSPIVNNPGYAWRLDHDGSDDDGGRDRNNYVRLVRSE